jgi:hypothetical protein
MSRTTAQVFDDHLDRADRGDVRGDIDANFAPDCVLMTSFGRFDRHDGVRAAADLLNQQVPGATYTYTQRSVHGDVAFLEWRAAGRDACVRDGADTFLIRDGRIQVMTIHYTVERLGPENRKPSQ